MLPARNEGDCLRLADLVATSGITPQRCEHDTPRLGVCGPGSSKSPFPALKTGCSRAYPRSEHPQVPAICMAAAAHHGPMFLSPLFAVPKLCHPMLPLPVFPSRSGVQAGWPLGRHSTAISAWQAGDAHVFPLTRLTAETLMFVDLRLAVRTAPTLAKPRFLRRGVGEIRN